MAAFDGGFDATAVDPKAALDPIPAANYTVVIVDSEEKPNAKGTGSYHQFTLEVIDGEHKGRKLWSRLNLNNPNAEAVKIARAELSAICRAVGVMKVNDSCDLHNLPMMVKVGLEKRKDTGELTNVVKGYLPKNAKPVNNGAAAPATAPWKRKTA